MIGCWEHAFDHLALSLAWGPRVKPFNPGVVVVVGVVFISWLVRRNRVVFSGQALEKVCGGRLSPPFPVQYPNRTSVSHVNHKLMMEHANGSLQRCKRNCVDVQVARMSRTWSLEADFLLEVADVNLQLFYKPPVTVAIKQRRA
eukprot:2659881-Lingulodinium_polyedra.AAC.1